MKRFLLWDYPRAGWQYDLMVALILSFIFLVPREIFKDQPRASNIVRLPGPSGESLFWIEPDLLNSIPKNAQGPKLESLLRSKFGKAETIVKITPIADREEEVTGYMAYAKP